MKGFSRSTQRKPSDESLAGLTTWAPAPVSPAYSLTQARLDAITRPTRTFYDAMVKWIGRFSASPTLYSTAVLKERAEGLGAEAASLKLVALRPEESVTPEEWMKAKERLAWVSGQLAAIAWVLESRAKYERWSSPSSQPTSKHPISTSEAPEEQDPSDPFSQS